jgi:hypothetical protein
MGRGGGRADSVSAGAPGAAGGDLNSAGARQGILTLVWNSQRPMVAFSVGFFVQEAAAAHLHAYFDQPLEFSRFLAAERLIADAGLSAETQAEILGSLARAMVTPSSPAGDGPAAGKAK